MTSDLAERPPLAPSVSSFRRSPAWRRFLPWPGNLGLLALVLGILGWFVSFLGSWNPSLWGDEAASIMSAERPIATLWPELGRVDAVHGTYYLFLHFWVNVFGASELSVRFPSTIAVGLAVAGTVVLGGRLFDRRTAALAGAVCIILPRMDFMATEARSYAIGTAIATWLTVFLVELVRKRESRRAAWLAFAMLFALAIYVFLYLVLLAPVFGIAMLLSPDGRAVFRRWIAAIGIGLVAALPVIVYALAQHNQISFLAHRNYMTFDRLIISQWFGNPWLAAVCWTLVLVGIVTLARRRPSSTALFTVVLLAGWLLLPMALLLVGNTFVAPMYTIRYLSFSTPAAALLVAVGIVALARWIVLRRGVRGGSARMNAVRMNAIGIIAVLGLAVLALPTYLQDRGQFAKDGGSDWRQAAQVIGANATAGDAVVFDEATRPSVDPRLAMHVYPQFFTGLVDVTLRTPFTERAGIWDSTRSIKDAASALETKHTVWDLELFPSGTPANVTALERLGFTVVRKIPVHRTVVYQLTRETP